MALGDVILVWRVWILFHGRALSFCLLPVSASPLTNFRLKLLIRFSLWSAVQSVALPLFTESGTAHPKISSAIWPSQRGH